MALSLSSALARATLLSAPRPLPLSLAKRSRVWAADGGPIRTAGSTGTHGLSGETLDQSLIFSPSMLKSPEAVKHFVASFKLADNFVAPDEEESLVDEVEPHLRRQVYQKDHWDEAILGFRETEKKHWNAKNTAILDRLRQHSFAKDSNHLPLVHVLDLSEQGHIKPHIDSARFCGDTVAVLSLLSDSVLKLVHSVRKEDHVTCLVRRRSLYVLTGTSRYDFTHEILGNEESFFLGNKVHKGRRISLVCRNEVEEKDDEQKTQ